MEEYIHLQKMFNIMCKNCSFENAGRFWEKLSIYWQFYFKAAREWSSFSCKMTQILETSAILLKSSVVIIICPTFTKNCITDVCFEEKVIILVPLEIYALSSSDNGIDNANNIYFYLKKDQSELPQRLNL